MSKIIDVLLAALAVAVGSAVVIGLASLGGVKLLVSRN